MDIYKALQINKTRIFDNYKALQINKTRIFDNYKSTKHEYLIITKFLK